MAKSIAFAYEASRAKHRRLLSPPRMPRMTVEEYSTPFAWTRRWFPVFTFLFLACLVFRQSSMNQSYRDIVHEPYHEKTFPNINKFDDAIPSNSRTKKMLEHLHSRSVEVIRDVSGNQSTPVAIDSSKAAEGLTRGFIDGARRRLQKMEMGGLASMNMSRNTDSSMPGSNLDSRNFDDSAQGTFTSFGRQLGDQVSSLVMQVRAKIGSQNPLVIGQGNFTGPGNATNMGMNSSRNSTSLGNSSGVTILPGQNSTAPASVPGQNSTGTASIAGQNSTGTTPKPVRNTSPPASVPGGNSSTTAAAGRNSSGTSPMPVRNSPASSTPKNAPKKPEPNVPLLFPFLRKEDGDVSSQPLMLNTTTADEIMQKVVDALTPDGIGGLTSTFHALVESGTLKNFNFPSELLPNNTFTVMSQGNRFDISPSMKQVVVNGIPQSKLTFLVISHAILMIIAYFTAIPIALILEHGHAIAKMLNKDRWRRASSLAVVTYMIGVLAGIVGFGFGFTLLGSASHFKTTHGAIGVFTFGLTVIAMALYLPPLRSFSLLRHLNTLFILALSLPLFVTGFVDIRALTLGTLSPPLSLLLVATLFSSFTLISGISAMQARWLIQKWMGLEVTEIVRDNGQWNDGTGRPGPRQQSLWGKLGEIEWEGSGRKKNSTGAPKSGLWAKLGEIEWEGTGRQNKAGAGPQEKGFWGKVGEIQWDGYGGKIHKQKKDAEREAKKEAKLFGGESASGANASGANANGGWV